MWRKIFLWSLSFSFICCFAEVAPCADQSDDFSINTLSSYTVTQTWTQGGTGRLVYDAVGQRARLLTGNDVGTQFAHAVPASDTGSFSVDFLPTAKYPNGGALYVRLRQDAGTYYEMKNTDGYGPGYLRKIVNGRIVAEAAFQSQFTQNTLYPIAIQFSPAAATVEAFGQTLQVNGDTTPIVVQSFEIELKQQDAYFDNILYSTQENDPGDTTAPVWDSTVGICSARDTRAGGSVTVEFGTATDDTDGANVRYNLYYAPAATWDANHWENNTKLANVTPTAGTTCARAFTLTGLTDGVQYVFGVRVADQAGNEDTNSATATAVPTRAATPVPQFADDFSTDTLSSYTVTQTWTQGGTGRLVYDAVGQRARLLTGNDVGTQFAHAVPASDTGSFSVDFLPTAKYPNGGALYVRLRQDAGTYYEMKNTDGYGPGYLRKIVNGRIVAEAAFQSQFTQNTLYPIAIQFSPAAATVEAFGQTLQVNGDTTPIVVQSFEIELKQQDAYFDNILYSTQENDPGDTTAPVWDSTVGICSARDTRAGGSVTVEFGTATDDTDGANVRYNLYYAPAATWDANHWENNTKLANVTPTAGTTCARAFTLTGLTDGVQYVFGVRVADQAGNEDTNSVTATATPGLFENFESGAAQGWLVVDNSITKGNWYVAGGLLIQDVYVPAQTEDGYDIGTYAFWTGSEYFDGEIRVRLKSEGVDCIGVMFRYQDDLNYYRFSMSKRQSYRKLEKRVGGVFKELASDTGAYTPGAWYEIRIVNVGQRILVYVDGEPILAAVDDSLTHGSVALYNSRNDRSEYDSVSISPPPSETAAVIMRPTANSITSTQTIDVRVLTNNMPDHGGVELVLDVGTSGEISLRGAPSLEAPGIYTGVFDGVPIGNHTLDVYVVDEAGQRLSNPEAHDRNAQVGTGGTSLWGFGDSITNGKGDDDASDDSSQDGRNNGGGYEPVLNDLLTVQFSHPHTVIDEGTPGDTSLEGVHKVDTALSRNPDGRYVLILFGTNDSAGSMPVDKDTFKSNMEAILVKVLNAGQIPLLGKVPIALGAYSHSEPYADPSTAPRNAIVIASYNEAIDELVAQYGLPIPPDFYTYFENHQDEFSDNLHPNGQGYRSMATLWFESIVFGQEAD
ncbi:MAG: GDSL-type esterase/lipase family protein [Desulfosoma sp.]